MSCLQKCAMFSFFLSLSATAMTPAAEDNSATVKQSVLVRRMTNAFDHTTTKYTGTHEEATAIAAGGFLYSAVNGDKNLKPRDFRRDLLQGILNDKTDVNKEYEFVTCVDYPIHAACHSDNHEDIVTELLARGAHIEQISPNGCATILHSCANAPRNLHKIIELLGPIKTKQMINCKNSSRWETPLHLAADSLNRDTLVKLLKHGAEINPTDSRDQTPLGILVKAYKWSFDPTSIQTFTDKVKICIKELLLQGADAHIGNTQEAYKNSPYKEVIREAFIESGKQDQLAYLEEAESK